MEDKQEDLHLSKQEEESILALMAEGKLDEARELLGVVPRHPRAAVGL